MKSRSSLSDLLDWLTRRHVRIYNLILAGLAIALGIAIFEFTSLDRDAKALLAGTLLAGSVGVAFAEITTTSDRRKVDELQRENSARCMAAYRLGEFFHGFHRAAASGQTRVREFETPLCLGEILGVKQTLTYIARDATPGNFADARDQMFLILPFVGSDLFTFFKLGFDVIAIRGSSASATEEIRVVMSNVEATLNTEGRPYFDYRVISAWRRVTEWWRSGEGDHARLIDVVGKFHAYFLMFGSTRDSPLGKARDGFLREIVAFRP